MRGRKPVPTALHILRGTFNATRHGKHRAGEPVTAGADLAPEPPPTLTPAQAELWKHAITHAPKGLIKQVDLSVLIIWVVAADQHERARQAQAGIDARGGDTPFLMTTKGGEVVSSPYLTIINQSGQRMMKAAAELGFIPASRPRLGSGTPEAQPGGGWDRLPAE